MVSAGRFYFPSSHACTRSSPALYAAAARPKLPNSFLRSASRSAEWTMADFGSKGSSRPRSAAVPGMNCAMPWAPFGLTALGSNRLSSQISRTNGIAGKPMRKACSFISGHTISTKGLGFAAASSDWAFVAPASLFAGAFSPPPGFDASWPSAGSGKRSARPSASGTILVAMSRVLVLLVDDLGGGTVGTRIDLQVPDALVVLIFDGLGGARHLLLARGALRRLERRLMTCERFREHAVDLVGPTAVMLHDLIDNLAHRSTALTA